MKTVFSMLCAVLMASSAAAAATRAEQRAAAWKALLPEALKKAEAAEAALAAFDNATDPNIVSARDSARLRIQALRSIPEIIEKSPTYFEWHLPESTAAQWTAAIDYYLACAREKTDPFAGKVSGVRALRSAVDGQLLFYVYKMPKRPEPGKTYPMYVGLHAGAGLTWKAGWIDGAPSTDLSTGTADGTITISPCGRGNNSYAAMGETAVYDAIAHATAHLPVDANRVTIGGASMGGTGAFRLAALRPDLFAAASSLTGGAYYGVPKGNGRWDATLLVDNFANTGMCILDAPKEGHFKDNRAFADALRENAKKYPGFYPHLEVTDPNGAHGVIDRGMRAEADAWVAQQVRKTDPAMVVYTTHSLRYDSAYWVTIDLVENPTAPARIEARMAAGKGIEVLTRNVARFHLTLETSAVPRITIDGAEPVGMGYFVKTDGKWTVTRERYPQGLVKKHGLSGPVVDVFMERPVLMVYGTLEQKDAAQNAMIDRVVERMLGAGDGARTLHAAFERKADTAVTADDIARKNLVLFGTSAQNTLVAKVAPKLPVQFAEGGIVMQGATHKGDLVMVYPNPLNAERYILLLPEDCGLIDLMTFQDLAVGVTRPGYGGQRYSANIHRTFDSRWQLTPRGGVIE